MKTINDLFEEQNPQDGRCPVWAIKLAESYTDQFKPKWISVDIQPPTRGRWSEIDYLVVTKYRYVIGRTFKGEWVDMDNKPIEDPEYYTLLLQSPLPTKP